MDVNKVIIFNFLYLFVDLTNLFLIESHNYNSPFTWKLNKSKLRTIN